MLNPETVLDGWREWDTSPRSRPTVVRELGGGRSNRSFLLDSEGRKMVLRINAPAPTLPGIGRVYEAEIWRAASGAGIAPSLLHADPAGRFLVSAYIENELSDRPQDDPTPAAMALELIQSTHHLDVKAPLMDYTAHIEAYWQQIATRRLPVDPSLLKQRKPMRDLLGELLASDSPRVLCHHDPVVENFVGTPKRMYLLDWEYAALGMAGMDYAALAAEWNVGAETLANQTGLPPGLLAVSKELYRYLCDLWETANIR